MERNINFTYIGALFLLIVIAMIGFIVWMSGGDLKHEKYTSYVVYTHEGISGIGVGASIRYKGILVGKIEHIGFKKNDTDSIQLNLLIDSSIPLLQGSCVSIESQGLAGNNFLNIVQGEGEVLHNGSELCYQKGFMGKLFENLDQSGGDAREIISEIKQFFKEENGKNIEEMIVAMKVILQNLDETRKHIDTLSVTANQTFAMINKGIQKGDYNIRQMMWPTMLGVENSLSEINRFFNKANLLLEKLEKSPYEAIFGQREQEAKR